MSQSLPMQDNMKKNFILGRWSWTRASACTSEYNDSSSWVEDDTPNSQKCFAQKNYPNSSLLTGWTLIWELQDTSESTSSCLSRWSSLLVQTTRFFLTAKGNHRSKIQNPIQHSRTRGWGWGWKRPNHWILTICGSFTLLCWHFIPLCSFSSLGSTTQSIITALV